MEMTKDYILNCPIPIRLGIGVIILGGSIMFLTKCVLLQGDLCGCCFSCLLSELLVGRFSPDPNTTTTSKPFFSKPKVVVDQDHVKLTEREVEMVMERLGMFHRRQLSKEKLLVGSKEIACVFEEQEPSLGEVKEAFDVFDKNGDGYIDSAELRSVLCALGVEQVSERDCRWLIKAFDDNGDGRIDFKDFIKLVEKSFS